jgi:hypothetical protein
MWTSWGQFCNLFEKPSFPQKESMDPSLTILKLYRTLLSVTTDNYIVIQKHLFSGVGSCPMQKACEMIMTAEWALDRFSCCVGIASVHKKPQSSWDCLFPLFCIVVEPSGQRLIFLASLYHKFGWLLQPYLAGALWQKASEISVTDN